MAQSIVRHHSGLFMHAGMEGKDDAWIITGVMFKDEYRLGDLDWTPTVILDIGAHIGSFAVHASRMFPGVPVYAFEPNPSNFQVLKCNAGYGMIHPSHCAIVGNDNGPKRFRPGAHTYEGGVSSSGIEVDVWTFDEAMTLVEIMRHEDISKMLVKLDCEGAEHGILRHSKLIDSAALIVGEWHEGEEEWDKTRAAIEDQFEVTELRRAHNGTFQLTRRRDAAP